MRVSRINDQVSLRFLCDGEYQPVWDLTSGFIETFEYEYS